MISRSPLCLCSYFTYFLGVRLVVDCPSGVDEVPKLMQRHAVGVPHYAHTAVMSYHTSTCMPVIHNMGHTFGISAVVGEYLAHKAVIVA